jgi:hypothetical protein
LRASAAAPNSDASVTDTDLFPSAADTVPDANASTDTHRNTDTDTDAMCCLHTDADADANANSAGSARNCSG